MLNHHSTFTGDGVIHPQKDGSTIEYGTATVRGERKKFEASQRVDHLKSCTLVRVEIAVPDRRFAGGGYSVSHYDLFHNC